MTERTKPKAGGRLPRQRYGGKGRSSSAATYIPTEEMIELFKRAPRAAKKSWDAMRKHLIEVGVHPDRLDYGAVKGKDDFAKWSGQSTTQAARAGAMNDYATSALGAALLLVVTLLWAVLGSPPYPFYQLLRWSSVATCLYVGYVVFREMRTLAALSVVLVGIAGTYAFGDFKKPDWALVNWATLVLMVLAITALYVGGRRSRTH